MSAYSKEAHLDCPGVITGLQDKLHYASRCAERHTSLEPGNASLREA
jgi:hypothetical protein